MDNSKIKSRRPLEMTATQLSRAAERGQQSAPGRAVRGTRALAHRIKKPRCGSKPRRGSRSGLADQEAAAAEDVEDEVDDVVEDDVEVEGDVDDVVLDEDDDESADLPSAGELVDEPDFSALTFPERESLR
ncbi:hypothetical protein [Actinoplanes sp. N902-109]|uniref:hypothetical protein n=1 Tax=Actinoplanes sp. (strain N902-109) TaxID=649831 RepID=UPI0003295E6A|nr:hypothetical protein [Actinoplanes sp. N902-109]AGL21099.1 hypothetical protein L083_7589 [Actinoplanes sp. N902-109]